MSEVLTDVMYQPPEGLTDYADREEEGKKLILYIGKSAVLDVASMNDKGDPELLLMRLESPAEHSLDMFYHPAIYAPVELAREVFDETRAINAFEDAA